MSDTLVGPLRDLNATDTSAVIQLDQGRVQLSSPVAGILRVHCVPEGKVRPNLSVAVVERPTRPLDVRTPAVIETDGVMATFQPDGTAVVATQDAAGCLARVFMLADLKTLDGGGMSITLRVGRTDPFFGMGEQTGPTNRRDRVVTNWNFDTYPHTPKWLPLYASFPVFVSRHEPEQVESAEEDHPIWYGVFLDNPARSHFDFGTEAADEVRIRVEAGTLDLYVMAGPHPRDVVERYSALTGTLEMLPMWMLAYQQSRWSYTPASRVLEVAKRFRAEQFPCDVLYLDIDYMDRYRSFTWHPQDFPDPPGLLSELHGMGFKVIPILNSAVAVDESFGPYQEGRERGYFLQTAEGVTYEATMWPGRVSFPDFTIPEARDWWAEQHEALLALGVDGLWNDMNEPTVFAERGGPECFPEDLPHTGDGVARPHLEVHSAYANLMNMATRSALDRYRPDERLPLMTRAAFSGVQRHAFLWHGDNSSWWDNMQLAIQLCVNLGLSGMPFSGPDIGGFNDECGPDLFLRWMQMGVFFPYVRAHTRQGSRDQEPWSYGPQVLGIARRFVKLRYELLPYVYSLIAQASRHGDLILRPLFYAWPDDTRSLAADDQFLLGPDILVAPIMAPGRGWRAVYLPPGEWFSFFANTLHEGGTIEVAEVPLDHIPVYIRANAIIPMMDAVQYVGEKPVDRIRWHVWAGRGEGSGWLYEDDGRREGDNRGREQFCETHVHGEFRNGRVALRFDPRLGPYTPQKRVFEVVIHGKRRPPTRSSIDHVEYRGGLLTFEFEDTGEGREIVLEW